MKLRVDMTKCVGHGRCYDLSPQLFDEDERGHCRLLVTDVPTEHEAAARRGAANCPEDAISIDDD